LPALLVLLLPSTPQKKEGKKNPKAKAKSPLLTMALNLQLGLSSSEDLEFRAAHQEVPFHTSV